MAKRTYGHTRTGKVIDDKMIESLADEAERGFKPDQLTDKPRGRGRPPLGASAKRVESVRLDPALRDEAVRRATAEGVSVSEVIRRALRAYMQSS